MAKSVEEYLAEGGKITVCPKGARILQDEDQFYFNMGMRLLWQILPIIGTGYERKPAKWPKKVRKGLKRNKRSKWG